MRKEEIDSYANQSFALVAVVILLLAAASVTIIYAMNQQEMERVSRTRTAIILDDIANGNHVTITNTAESLAWVAIYYAAEVKCDTGNLSVEFRDSFKDYIENNYPQRSGRYTVNVTDYNVSLTLKTYDYFDVLPPAATYDNKAKANQYKPANIHLGGEVKQTNGFVCYQLTGYVNYSVNDTRYGNGLSKSIRMDQVLKDKHPFLSDKFSSFKADGSRDSNGIGRIVKYILTTIAQFRAAQGYAWRDGKLAGALGDLVGAEGIAKELNALSEKQATDLLTASDVELATNLAVLLVEVKAFRTYDQEAMDALEGKFPGIKNIVTTWLYSDRIDPADIIVLYQGYGSRSADQPLNLKLIIMQAFYAIVDQLILKYFDLWGMGPFISEFFTTVANLTKMIDDIIEKGEEFLDTIYKKGELVSDTLSKYGIDLPFGRRGDSGVSAAQTEKARNYIIKNLNNAGIGVNVFAVPLTGWPKYDMDLNRTYTTKVLVQGKPVYKNVTCNYTIDADHNITNGYETNVSKNISYIGSYDSRVYTIDVKIKKVEQEVRFKPVDITSANAIKDHIWEEFYNKYLKIEKKEGMALVKDKLGDFFSLSYDTVLLLRDLLDDISDQLLGGNLTDAYQYVEDVHPSDRRPFLKQMEQQVFGAVDNVLAYYTTGPGGDMIREVLKNIFGDGGLAAQNRIIDGMMAMIKDHFDELVGTDNTYRFSFNTDPQVVAGIDLAQRLTANSAYLQFTMNRSYAITNKLNAWVEPREHEMWQVNQYWNWFDVNFEVPTEQQLEDAAQARLGKASWCDYNWLSPSHLEDVFYSLRPYVDDAYAEVKGYELNETGGICWKLNLTKLDPSDPNNYFTEFKGIKKFGLVMFNMMTGGAVGGGGEGILDTFANWLKYTVGQIITGADFANTPYYLTTMALDQFEFFSGNLSECKRTGNVESDSIELTQGPKYLPVALRPFSAQMSTWYYRYLNDMDYGNERRLFVDFYNPEIPSANASYGYDASDLKGMRYNSPDRFSIPYQCDWNIRMFGTVDLSAKMKGMAMIVNGEPKTTTYNDTLVINITVRVSIMTGWALSGVNYEQETTAIEYIQDVIDRAWQYLVQMVKPTIDSVMNVIDTISNFASKIMGYAQQAMEFINNAEQFLITTLQTFIGNVLDKIVKWLLGYKDQIEAFLRAIKFSLYGVDFTICINTDYLNGKYNRTKPTPIFDIYIKAGSDIDLTMRVTTVPKSKYGYDVTLTGPFRIEGIEFSLIVDPFMCFYNHMFSLYGKKVDSNGNGWGLEIQIPELLVYKKLDASVVIGTPAGIPIPIISISVFPTIGVDLKYGFPRMTDIIMNEFSFYRVELYNPTPKSIDINGWKVANRNDPTRYFNITKDVPIWIGSDVKDDLRREKLENYNYTLLQPGEENKNTTQTEGFIVPRDAAGYKLNKTDSGLLNKTHYLYIPPLSYATIHFIEAYPKPYWQPDPTDEEGGEGNESEEEGEGDDGDEGGGEDGEEDKEEEGEEDDEDEEDNDPSLSSLNPAELKERLQVPSASRVITDLIGGDISFLGTGKGLASAGEGIKLYNAEGDMVDQTVIKRYKGTEWNPDPNLHSNITIEGEKADPKDWFIKPKEATRDDTRGNFQQSTDTLGTPKSWQRKYDAGYEWVLKEENFGLLNNHEVPKLDIKIAVLTALYEAFAESYIENRIQQKIEGANITLDDVVSCIKSAINKFIEKILELIRRVVIELEFYIDMGVAPTGQLKPVGGIRISFVMDGEGLALLLEWLVKVVGFMVNKLLFNDKSGGFPPLPSDLPEHMFFRFATYVSMDSLPESIKAKLPPDATAAGMSINFMVQANLPVIGALLGEDWGDWRIDFGIYLTGPTKPLVQALYQTKTMDNPDFYLIKGQVFQIRGGGK